MYVPAHFAMLDIAAVRAFMRAHAFALIAGHIGAALEFAYAPVVLSDEPGPLGAVRFHLARANPFAGIADGAMVKLSIMGPHAYVSPDWYSTPGLVPTWNYIAVEGAGCVKRLSDSGLRRLLSDLTAQEENALAPKQPWKMARVAPERLEELLNAIVGFELPFQSLQGKEKLSQNRAVPDGEGALAGRQGEHHDYRWQRQEERDRRPHQGNPCRD